jgi:hypothetical protein
VNADASNQQWQRILAEYALARAEYSIATQLFAAHQRESTFDSHDMNAPEVLAERKARDKMFTVRERVSALEAELPVLPGALKPEKT